MVFVWKFEWKNSLHVVFVFEGRIMEYSGVHDLN